MNKVTRLGNIFVLLTVVLFLLGCSIIPKSLEKMKEINPFSEPTMTSTLTPLPTSTATLAPTATQKPFLTMKPCTDKIECDGAEMISNFAAPDEDFEGDIEVEIPYDQSVFVFSAWYAMDEDYLAENMKHINWFLTIDGEDYFEQDWPKSDTLSDSSGEYPGTTLGVALSGWRINEPHTVEIGFTVDDEIFDGWETFDAGYTASTTWVVTPVKEVKATATFVPLDQITPEASITPTKKPVSTSAPAKPTATQAQNLVYDMTLKVENKCPEQHIVIFSGPTRLKYTVGPGQTVEYQAPQGSYTWIIDNIYTGGPQELNMNVWTLTLCN